ncbi:MAG: DUF4230 domain-containing protein [Elusimicrobiota bacterium]|jgi:hypothetical protein|nr:DUF4230 domain-containing protein [Elusimicrobiota bacterium]
MKKFILFLLIIAAAALIIIQYAPPISFSNVHKTSNISSSMVKDILPIGEYASLTYSYTTVAEFKDEKSKKLSTWAGDLEIPLSKRNFLYVYDGAVKLGFQAEKIEVKQSGGIIHLIMPKIEILSHTIDMNNVKSYDIQKGFFSDKLPLEAMLKLIESKKQEMEEQILKSAVITQAQESAERQFGSLLQNLPGIKNEYTIDFIWDNDNVPTEKLKIDRSV